MHFLCVERRNKGIGHKHVRKNKIIRDSFSFRHCDFGFRLRHVSSNRLSIVCVNYHSEQMQFCVYLHTRKNDFLLQQPGLPDGLLSNQNSHFGQNFGGP
jgi:hypothetical protein